MALPVKFAIESAVNGYYAFAFGGGLCDTVTTDVFASREAALRSLCGLLKPLNRIPDRGQCNLRTELGRQLESVIAGFGEKKALTKTILSMD